MVLFLVLRFCEVLVKKAGFNDQDAEDMGLIGEEKGARQPEEIPSLRNKTRLCSVGRGL